MNARKPRPTNETSQLLAKKVRQPLQAAPHQPTRQRERAMKRFTSPGHAQRFLSAFSGISPHFRPRRHRLTAKQYRREMTVRFTTWNEVTGLTTAA